MSDHLAASLGVTVLILLVLAWACAKNIPAPPPVMPDAWTIPWMANGSDRFCVEIVPAPWIEPGDQGVRCTDVHTVRHWMAGLRRAE